MKALITVVALLVVFGIGFLLYSSPTVSPEMTDAEIAQIEAEVMAVMQDFIDGFNELDMAKAIQTMHPDHMTASIGGQVTDQSGYGEFLDGWVENKESWQGSWHETNVRILSPDAAVFTGTYSVTMRYTDGRVRTYPQAAWVILVEKTPAGWKWSMGGNSNSGYEEVEEG